IAEDLTTNPAATITMHLNSIHPRDAIAEFCKQTGTSVIVWPENYYEQQRGPGNQQVSVMDANVDQETYWSALNTITSAANLVPYHMGQPAVTLQEANGRTTFGKKPVSSGPLATIVAESIYRNHSIGL